MTEFQLDECKFDKYYYHKENPASQYDSSKTTERPTDLCTKKIQFRLLVIASSMAFAALSVYGVMNIQQGLPLKDLTTMGSNLHSYFELEESSFENQVGPETALYFIEETDCSQGPRDANAKSR